MIPLLFLAALLIVGGASAATIGPFDVTYEMDGSIWTGIAQVRTFETSDGVPATGWAGVVLGPDGWALIMVHRFEDDVYLTMDDVIYPMSRDEVDIFAIDRPGGRQAVAVTDGAKVRSVWTLDGGWDGDILVGRDMVAATTGGLSFEEAARFLGLVEVRAA